MRADSAVGSRQGHRRKWILAIAAGTMATWPLVSADGATRYYVGSGGLWQDGPWSNTPGGPGGTPFPGMGDSGFVNAGATYVITTNASSGMAGLGTVQLDSTGSASVTLDKTTNINLGCSSLIVGANGLAKFVSGAGSVSASAFAIGQSAGSTGTVVFGNTSLSIGSSMTVGAAGNGYFTMNGGGLGAATSTTPLTVGQTGSGTFTMNGGTASLGQIFAGSQTGGSGIIHINSANVTVQGTTRMGDSTNDSTGLMFLNGATVSFTAAVTVNANSGIFAGNSVVSPVTGGWTISGGGTVDLGSSLYPVSSTTPLTINDGCFKASTISVGNGSVNFSAGTIELTNSDFNPASNSMLGNGSINLTANKALIISGKTTLDPSHPIVINGGTFSTGTTVGNFANLQFNSGTFRLTGEYLHIGPGERFGATYTVDSTRRLEVGIGNRLDIESAGQLYITTGSVDADDGVNNFGLLQLGSPVARVSGNYFDNYGLLSGTGRVIASLQNHTGAEVRIGPTDQMRFENGGHSNSGLISMLGGTADFTGTLNNDALGRITGRGTLHTAGLNNSGSILLSADVSDVYGPLTNMSGGKTIVSGNATASFYDSVTNQPGSEFRVSTNSTAVFFGTVTGGNFTGPGVKDFEGPALPGPIFTSGSTIVGPIGNVVAQHVREAALSVEGKLAIAANGTSGGVSRVGSLSIPGGTIDLTNNALVVDYDSTSPAASIRSQIISGRTGGTWHGPGLTSSLGDANHFALGFGEASAIFSSFNADFIGQSVDNTTVLIRFTRYGDANLDGVVNTTDFTALAAGFNQPGKFWATGDFNYDGKVNAIDFNFLAANYGLPLPAPALGSLVPEPAAAGCAFAIMGVALRRQRSSKR